MAENTRNPNGCGTKECVALKLAEQISGMERSSADEKQDRKYYLDLYVECWRRQWASGAIDEVYKLPRLQRNGLQAA
jgi:hypothetical protein